MEGKQIGNIYAKVRQRLTKPEDLYLIQSVELQRLAVCVGESIVDLYDASTSRFGQGIRENSFKTPVGLHRVRDKIGSGAPLRRIFKGRRDTGIDWDGCFGEDNLILTRILRLEGLEEGINKGRGVDSYERFIYIHGTNREDLVGTPLSHGCIALRNADVVKLFEAVREGTIVYIDPVPVTVRDSKLRSIHFTGIFGSGMSALAQYLRFQGVTVSGSDRLIDHESTNPIKGALESLGCIVVKQDGSGVTEGVQAVCVSTAIEDSNPDVAAARRFGLPVVHRSELLAAVMSSKTTIAVAGTSGKSTVTAMIFDFLTACGKSPSLMSGAPLLSLEGQGVIGNAFSGGSDLLVVEADESDGTIVRYAPDMAVILNVSKDHKDVEELTELFRGLISRCAWVASNADDPVLASLPAAARFGGSPTASWRADHESLHPTFVILVRNGIKYCLPMPGGYNLENLRAALCVCDHLRCDGQVLAGAAGGFQGVGRRFAITETNGHIRVIDDFAHNPAKIAAALRAAQGLSCRVLAVYQPHGFGPTRFLRKEYVAVFREVFRENDSLYLLPIYYAGGTADKSISSDDIARDLYPVAFHVKALRDRRELLADLKAHAKPGDCILLMGARDPSLPALAREIVDMCGGRKG